MKISDVKYYEDRLKNNLFNLIDKYTSTPTEIKNIMELNSERLDTIKNIFLEVCHVDGKSREPSSLALMSDIENIAEKYLSINWHDINIFTKDRDAYLTAADATGDEETTVKQSASDREPLQTKSAFFDNKKTIYKDKLCSKAVFVWRRKKPWSSGPKKFTVTISVKKNKCVFKFTTYTMREDIGNVIFSIIGADENQIKP